MRARGIAASLVALVACTSPAVAIGQPRAVDPESCTGCHAASVHAWRGSLHAQAAVDPLFVAEHARRRDPWCLTCHDPRGEGRGIDCAVCHVRNGNVVSTTASRRAPHATVADASMGTAAACATCHDFDFPLVAGQPMQNTLDEWRASLAGAQAMPCQQCHMPRVGNAHDHGTPGRRDAALAARALTVAARAWDDGRETHVELVLTSRAGHAVPTGDLYRRLVVSAEADGVRGERVLRRSFTMLRGQLHERSDDRVPARGERRVELALPVRARHVSWSIELRAVSDARAEELDLAPHVWRTELGRGDLAVGSGGAPERRDGVVSAASPTEATGAYAASRRRRPRR